MRLGMWNRLAIVAGAVFSAIAPTWFVISSNADLAARREKGYTACIRDSVRPGSVLDADYCSDIFLPAHPYYLGWTEWWQGVGASALIAVVIYGLIALTVWTAKWIWRGRAVNGNYPQA